MKQDERRRHVAAEGGDCKLAVENIITHVEFLLDDAQKAAINWHPDQSVSLAVMRIISAWQEAEQLCDTQEELIEAMKATEHPAIQKGLDAMLTALEK